MPVILANMPMEFPKPSLPEGLLIELVTPLTPAGALDHASLAGLLRRVLPSASGLVAGSPGVGEALELPRAVRLELFTAVLENLEPPLPLFFGITGATTAETQSLALELEEILSQCPTPRPVYWMDLPLWHHSNRGLPQTYRSLTQSLHRPLILMNHPHLIRGRAKPFKHVNIRTAVFKKLTSLPEVEALIYHGEMRRFLHYYAAMMSQPDFMLYEGDEARFLTRPGAMGLVSVGAQLFPHIWRQVTQACLFPDEAEGAGNRRRQLWEWSDLLQRLHEIYQLHPAPLIKLGLFRQEVIEFPAIWPSTPAYPHHLGELFLQVLDGLKDRWNF
ncbi:MAG: dihydrodipicolinate synthase family protein [Deltaproteobacteria bacterium]|nr:dihydrodipicolinate synthase family protein [Deltaproteobacteria bacterium]